MRVNFLLEELYSMKFYKIIKHIVYQSIPDELVSDLVIDRPSQSTPQVTQYITVTTIIIALNESHSYPGIYEKYLRQLLRFYLERIIIASMRS